MSGQHETSSGFAKAFVPGLVLGLLVGAFVGATLPPLLSGKKLPNRTPGLASPAGDRDREVYRDEDGVLDELPTEEPAIEEPGTPDDAGEPTETTETTETTEDTDAPPAEGETGGDGGKDDG